MKTLGWLQTALDCGLTTELVISTAAVPNGRYAHFFSWPYAAFWTSGECWGSRSLRVLQQSSESDIVRAGPLRLAYLRQNKWTGQGPGFTNIFGRRVFVYGLSFPKKCPRVPW